LKYKNICVVTTTRAEFGALRNLIKKILGDEELNLELVVTGTHLSYKYGYTVAEIKEEGLPITACVPILSELSGEDGVVETMANALRNFGKLFREIEPEMLVVTGDRYEVLAICEAAVIHKIPIAHISGGEVTEGAIDDVMRHCITKMSMLHFPACDEYRKRIIQLGENPERVFDYGDIGVENVKTIDYMTTEELEMSLGITLPEEYACVTYHPTTLDVMSPAKQIQNLLEAIAAFPEILFIFTGANADAGGEEINEMIRSFAMEKPNCVMYESLGSRRYISLMKGCKIVLGNSSSGIIEAPCFGVPTVNVGIRQKGRAMASSIITCATNRDDIVAAIRKALSPSFQKLAQQTINPYGFGNTSEEIVREIKRFLDGEHQITKQFYDVEFEI
jgi:GDP/UDP-N,N'-diacetylbacillosamine 2-epimerase (hydrolysing)